MSLAARLKPPGDVAVLDLGREDREALLDALVQRYDQLQKQMPGDPGPDSCARATSVLRLRALIQRLRWSLRRAS